MKNTVTGILIIIFIGSIYYFFLQKTCDLLSPEFDFATAHLEERLDEKGFIYKVWQKKNGQWYGCSTRFEKFGHF